MTNFMELSHSRAANNFLATQKITRILWKENVYYSIQKDTPPALILTQIDPVHAPIQLL
jgi:hypothetical protein